MQTCTVLCCTQLSLQNCCINLHVWYAVGKSITQSKWRQINFAGKGAIIPTSAYHCNCCAFCCPLPWYIIGSYLKSSVQFAKLFVYVRACLEKLGFIMQVLPVSVAVFWEQSIFVVFNVYVSLMLVVGVYLHELLQGSDVNLKEPVIAPRVCW